MIVLSEAIHAEIEHLLDRHRRAAVAEAIILDAIVRALRSSSAMIRSGEMSRGTRRR
jgi:hypothetical protein